MASTVIGSSLVVDGEITADEDLVICGTVKGSISNKHDVHVEQTANVQADITSASTIIDGHLKGSVVASDRVELKSDGRMVGNIKSPRIQIAEGASFKGSVDMEV